MKNLSSAQERAAAYALNILENPQKFERKLAKSEELQTEVAAFQSAVGNLAYSAALTPLETVVKTKLFQRLDRLTAQPPNLSELLAWPLTDLQQVAKDLANWEPFPAPLGSERSIWLVDKSHAQVAFFLWSPEGGALPKHWHGTDESILVLEGSFTDDDGRVYSVGDRFEASAHTSHQPHTSPRCLILGITGSDPFGVWRTDPGATSVSRATANIP
jgi:uncharacterized cupin superfamily protein